MACGYEEGDVVLVHYPFREDPTKTKLRPAVVADASETPLLVLVTGTDRRAKAPGRWIPCRSAAGVMMGLRKDSFLNYGNHVRLDCRFIERKIGECPYTREIKRHLWPWAFP